MNVKEKLKCSDICNHFNDLTPLVNSYYLKYSSPSLYCSSLVPHPNKVHIYKKNCSFSPDALPSVLIANI